MSAVHANLIGGEWTPGTPKVDQNPSDLSDVVGEYHCASVEQARQAVEAARRAFPSWSQSGIQARADLLDRVGTEILARRAELGDLLAREEGKTLPEATGEVTRAGNIFKFFAGEALRTPGEKVASVRPGLEVEVTREPVGVVSLITPWNFPIAIPAWKTAPALAFGNCVILKPADLVPGCAWAMADIIQRAGCPPGVFNLVNGSGSLLGATLTGEGVDAVSFTGSLRTGQHLLTEGAKRQLKLQLEMGGKNPLIILNDAELDVAVRVALDGSFLSTGQRCTASSRLIVQKGIHDRFVAALSAALKNQVIDDARSPGTTIGPVVDQRQLEQDMRYIDQARAQGGRLYCGGERLERPKEGFYLSPALFTETTAAMTLNREEVFGPVAGVIAVDSYEEALATANDTPFGICAGICTTSLKLASHFKRASQAGMVMVNLPTAGVDYHVPFGGRKASSYGPREQGHYAVEFYTTVKTTYINPG
jgi:acyl-CoA reductase-like NAD-dependent aldehyde dehydrogenase